MSDELVEIERPNPPAEIWVSILKSAFGAVPWVGQALMEIVFDGRSRVKQNRINLYLKEAADEIREEKVDHKFLKTDEFSDLLEDILQRVATNRSEEKRVHFKNLLTQAIHGHRPPDMSRTFINILSEITEAELRLLAQLHKIHKQGKQLQQEGKEVDLAIQLKKDDVEIFGIQRSQYLLMVQSMFGKGLLIDERRWDADPYDFIQLNDLGVQFYEYIVHT